MKNREPRTENRREPPLFILGSRFSVLIHFCAWINAPHLRQLHQHAHRRLHLLQAGPFQRRVEVVLAGRQVRRRQAQLGQPRAVGAAADDRAASAPGRPAASPPRRTPPPAAPSPARRPCCGTAASPATSILRRGILAPRPAGRRRAAARPCSASFGVSKSRSRMRDRHLGRRRPRCGTGAGSPRGRRSSPGDSVCRGSRSRNSPARRTALTIRPLAMAGWMLTPRDRHHGQVGGERLAVDLAGAAAVERVADHGAELLQIDVIDAVADLLVAGEADADRAVRDLADGPSGARPPP